MSKRNSLFLEIDNNINVSSDEGYDLEIKNNRIIIKGTTKEGIYRGWQSLIQIIELAQNSDNIDYIPTGNIIDQPEYRYRGTMLDVARHFFTLEEVIFVCSIILLNYFCVIFRLLFFSLKSHVR